MSTTQQVLTVLENVDEPFFRDKVKFMESFKNIADEIGKLDESITSSK